MTEIILWLHYTVVRLIVVFGIVFIDYLVYLTMKESTFFKSRVILSKILWVILMIISLLILQGVPVLSGALIQDRYTSIIQNMDLQLIVLFYFLHMLKGKLMVYINLLVAIVITFYYMHKGEYTSVSSYLITILNIALIYLCCYTIVYLKDKEKNNFVLYCLFMIFFGAIWGLKMLPALDFKPIGYIYFLLNFIFLMLLVRLINQLVRRQLIKFNKLSLEARTDFLTGVGNRLSFEQEFSQRFELSRTKENLTFAMIDIDYFKQINDNYGHDIGDIIIKNIAEIISDTLFQYQLESQVFRIGGEEFGILFQEKSSAAITEIIETISKKVNDFSLDIEGKEVGVTISVGVSRCRKTDTNKEELYKRADKYLYLAKGVGRNAIFMEGKIRHLS